MGRKRGKGRKSEQGAGEYREVIGKRGWKWWRKDQFEEGVWILLLTMRTKMGKCEGTWNMNNVGQKVSG